MKRSGKLSLLLVCSAFISSVAFMTLEAGTKSATSRPKELATGLNAHCWCVISKDSLMYHATGVLKDLTGEVNKTYTFQGQSQQDDCQDKCQKKAHGYIKDQSIAAMACAANAADHTDIMAWSAVGTAWYRGAEHIGILKNIPQMVQTTCTCPSSWTCNGCSPQVAGGVTTDGKCKKWAGLNTISPYPPDGTPIGSWGFTWGNSINAWGTSANGGAPTCVTTVIQPGSCGWY